MLRIFLNTEEIKIPERLNSDRKGFDFLSKMSKIINIKKKYILNFSFTSFIGAHLCAVLAAIINESKKNGSYFEILKPEDSYVRQSLINIGFVYFIEKGNINNNPVTNTCIPLSSFDMKSDIELYNYFDKHLFSKKLPKMSELAKKKIKRSILEIYQNSVIHSNAECVFVSGQEYMKNNKVTLTMVEIGHSFKHNITKFKDEYKGFTGIEAIDWAVVSGNTTKPKKNTGGLGLDVIRKFLKINKGGLIIRSADGYWEEKKGNICTRELGADFKGSIVIIEFNLYDTNKYLAVEEINANQIL